MSYDQMVCLVGMNPLPIYLGVRQFVAPENYNQVYLIHSGERRTNVAQSTGTAGVAQRIAKALGNRPQFRPLADEYSPSAVEAVFAQLVGNRQQVDTSAALNYTGGTKVMSAFAVLAWSKLCGHIDRTLYLQEDENLFRFGDGRNVPLEMPLSMDDVARLHGVSEDRSDGFPEGCQFRDQLLLLKAWSERGLEYFDFKFTVESQGRGRPLRWPQLNEGPQLRMLKEQYDGVGKQWTGREWKSCLAMLTETTRQAWQQTPCPSSNRAYYDKEYRIPASELYKQFRFFVNNGWMEMLVLTIVNSLPALQSEFRDDQIGVKPSDPLLAQDNVRAGQHYSVQGQDFESDIVAVLNHRLKYFSVTTSTAESTIKEKAFEANYRAGQIGGGLAGYCVVCLADDDVVRNCNKSLNTARPDSRDRIFGLSDLTAWLNGHAETLYRFLTQ